MLDPYMLKIINIPLKAAAKVLQKTGIKPGNVTIAGFLIGMLSVLPLAKGMYITGLVLIMINRLFDGLDGALARQTRKTDAGGFLDICLDFIFYSAVVTGFALSNPANNAVPAVVLLLGFMGTGSSFLAFAVMAQKNKISSTVYPHKSFYYLGGITEGTETIIFFIIICLLPYLFGIFAYIFAALCALTTVIRIVFGYLTLVKIKN